MNEMLLGAIAMASLVAGLFFLRFWRSSGDRFFFYFALSFLIEGVNRILLASARGVHDEDSPVYYLIRLLAHSLILWAILDKNRPRKNKNKQE
jgi:hypothetical protein